MLSIDTNLLFYAYAKGRPEHERAYKWLLSIHERSDVVLTEWVLVEFYRLIRNPVLSGHPKSAPAAAALVQAYRQHPRWRIEGFPRASKEIHDALWKCSATDGFAYRRIFDVRLALCLKACGVTRFATRNVDDFLGLGIDEVFDPLAT